MAKWGEGDPRWIVEERPDATNVNNWHWTEKNATPWSKERIAQLFTDFSIAGPDMECTVNGVDKCTGEATVNNRKGKLIFFYEWEVVLKWTGCLTKTSKDTHKGKITIPNLSEENDLDDVEITVTIDNSNDESETLKQFMYNVGRDRIREKIGLYIKELKEEYSKNLILPKKGDDSSLGAANDTSSSARNMTDIKNALNSIAGENANAGNVGCKLETRSIKLTVHFQCSANDLYNALTKADMMTAFTRSPAKVDAVRGGEFILYGGNVHGKFQELVPEQKIVQTWRLKNWPAGHYSTVTIKLEETNTNTILSLKQTGIPSTEIDAIKNNWHRYYWQSIMQTFGFGSFIGGVL